MQSLRQIIVTCVKNLQIFVGRGSKLVSVDIYVRYRSKGISCWTSKEGSKTMKVEFSCDEFKASSTSSHPQPQSRGIGRNSGEGLHGSRTILLDLWKLSHGSGNLGQDRT